MPRTTAADTANASAKAKEDKFKELASKRTQKSLDALDVLGNCFNRANYTYTDDQVEKIFEALTDKLAELRKLTEPEAKRERAGFVL